MKQGQKVSIIVIILFLGSFLVVSRSLATSGACSGHDGVDCSAGSDYDGSVICNDGWKSSTVQYKDMAMCKKSIYNLPTYRDSQCYYTQSPSSVAYINEYINYMNTGKIPENWTKSDVTDHFQRYLDYLTCPPQKTSCPAGEIFFPDTNKTECGSCNLICQSQHQYDNNIYGTKKGEETCSCYCNDGYEWNVDKTICIQKIVNKIEIDNTKQANKPIKAQTKINTAPNQQFETKVKLENKPTSTQIHENVEIINDTKNNKENKLKLFFNRIFTKISSWFSKK